MNPSRNNFFIQYIAPIGVIFFALFWTWVGQSFLAHNQLNDADSSYFMYGGHILLEGQNLYRDFWDQKPPAIFIQNALFEFCFDRQFGVYAFFHGLTVLGLGILIYFCFRRWMNKALLFAMLVAYFYAFNLNHYLDYGNRPEFGLAIFDSVGILLALWAIEKEKKSFWFWAAFCSGIAFWYKPVGMAGFLSIFAFMFYQWIFHKQMDKKGLGFCILGFASAVVPVLLYFGLQGQWGEPLYASIIVPLSLADESAPSLGQAAKTMLYKFGPLWGFLWPILFVPFGWFKLQSKDNLRYTLLTLFCLASCAGIIAQRRDHPHYYLQGVVPLVLISFTVLHYMFLNTEKRMRQMALLFLTVSSIFFGHYHVLKQWVYYQDVENDLAHYQDVEQLSKWIQENIKEDQEIYYWSHGYQPYLCSEKKSPGRVSPLLIKHGPTGAQLVREDLKRLKNLNVECIIERDHSEAYPKILLEGQSLNTLEQQACFQEYQHWKNSEYVKIPETIQGYRVYRRKA